MYIEQALMTYLNDQAVLTALLPGGIHFVKARQDTYMPYLCIHKISDVPEHAHDGNANLNEARFQLSAFAETYKEIKDINSALKDALDHFTGVMGGDGGCYISRCFLDSESDNYEDSTELFYSPVDYLIQYSE